MLNDKTYGERVASGKAVEQEILDTLQRNGLTVEKPTAAEDMHDKIDGWVMWKGARVPIQIKFREGGDDVIFEIVKDLDRNIVGRDLVSKAELYVVKDRIGTVRLFSVKQIKDMVNTVYAFIKRDMQQNTSRTNWGSRERCNVKITVDSAHGNRKLMAYFNPAMVTPLASWDA